MKIMTKIINIKNAPVNWQTDPNYTYIGRAGKGQDGYFGNPFHLKSGDKRGSTLERYREYFIKRLKIDPEFKRRIEELRDKTLICFCKPALCHGDIIVEYLGA